MPVNNRLIPLPVPSQMRQIKVSADGKKHVLNVQSARVIDTDDEHMQRQKNTNSPLLPSRCPYRVLQIMSEVN